MIRKLVGAFSLAAVVVTGAQAQGHVPYTETFNFYGASGNNFSTYQGDFTGSANISLTGETINSPFQIWCIDPLHGVNSSTLNPAWVTPLATTLNAAQTDFSHTYTGGAADNLTTFKEAAYLASQMGTGVSSSIAADYEQAMWTVMGYYSVGSLTANQLADYNAGINATNYNSVNIALWGVINETSYYGGGQLQEFLYCRAALSQCTGGGTTLQVTPEPATMSLLAVGMLGMAGTSFRRRKRKA